MTEAASSAAGEFVAEVAQGTWVCSGEIWYSAEPDGFPDEEGSIGTIEVIPDAWREVGGDGEGRYRIDGSKLEFRTGDSKEGAPDLIVNDTPTTVELGNPVRLTFEARTGGGFQVSLDEKSGNLETEETEPEYSEKFPLEVTLSSPTSAELSWTYSSSSLSERHYKVTCNKMGHGDEAPTL